MQEDMRQAILVFVTKRDFSVWIFNVFLKAVFEG